MMRHMQIAMGKRDVGSDAPTKDSLIYYIGNAGTSDIVLFSYKELNEDDSGYRQESRS